MEPGKLCVIRQRPYGPYYNLQCRQNGKTLTRYVPRDQAELVAAHAANYERFQALVAEWTRAQREAGSKKRTHAGDLLAQDPEIQQLMARFQAAEPIGVAVQQWEGLVRTASFKPANTLVGFLLQVAADRIDAAA